MDWTFWVGGLVLLALWAATQWAFSRRRQSEGLRGRSREQADAIIDVERQSERGRYRF